MKVYLFWSFRDQSVFGLTLDAEGKNLPPELAPWSKNEDGDALPLAGTAVSMASNRVLQSVQRHGFHLVRHGRHVEI